MNVKVLLSLLAASLVVPTGAVAAAELPATPGPGGAELVNFAGSLLVVVVSILVFGWLYGKLKPGMNGGSDCIRVVATRALGPRERLVVVDLNGEQILVGVSQGHMQTLHTLDKPLETASSAAPTESGFAARLKGMLTEAKQ